MLAVASQDAEAGKVAMDAHWAQGVPGDVVASAERAIDLDAEENVCPACATAFATGPNRCPSCGLRLF